MGFCPELPRQHGSGARRHQRPYFADHGSFQRSLFDRANHDGDSAGLRVLPRGDADGPELRPDRRAVGRRIECSRHRDCDLRNGTSRYSNADADCDSYAGRNGYTNRNASQHSDTECYAGRHGDSDRDARRHGFTHGNAGWHSYADGYSECHSYGNRHGNAWRHSDADRNTGRHSYTNTHARLSDSDHPVEQPNCDGW